jgi:hypothetical protein
MITFTDEEGYWLWQILVADLNSDACDAAKDRTRHLINVLETSKLEDEV